LTYNPNTAFATTVSVFSILQTARVRDFRNLPALVLQEEEVTEEHYEQLLFVQLLSFLALSSLKHPRIPRILSMTLTSLHWHRNPKYNHDEKYH